MKRKTRFDLERFEDRVLLSHAPRTLPDVGDAGRHKALTGFAALTARITTSQPVIHPGEAEHVEAVFTNRTAHVVEISYTPAMPGLEIWRAGRVVWTSPASRSAYPPLSVAVDPDTSFTLSGTYRVPPIRSADGFYKVTTPLDPRAQAAVFWVRGAPVPGLPIPIDPVPPIPIDPLPPGPISGGNQGGPTQGGSPPGPTGGDHGTLPKPILPPILRPITPITDPPTRLHTPTPRLHISTPTPHQPAGSIRANGVEPIVRLSGLATPARPQVQGSGTA